jgi:glycosyltransferase involved in cell wall biosynthesis
MSRPRIALVHHWLVSPGGAEKVLLKLHQMYPDAPIFTAAYLPQKFPEFSQADVRTTFLNKIPLLKQKHQLFPLFVGIPFKTLNLNNYDIVISSCAAEAKYVRTGPQTLHICYCHTPVRYYWSDYDWYMADLRRFPFGRLNPVARLAFQSLVKPLRRVDYLAAQGVDVFIANSRHIQDRIKKYYHRESVVIYPPIETKILRSQPSGVRDYYLILGRQVASKRLDVAVQAFNKLGLPLKVAGSGEQISRWKPLAGPNIEFLGRVSDEERNRLFAGAKGFVFPPEEDFGMTPVEAMSAGTPVIAFRGGGAPEYVVEGETGVLFDEQAPEALIQAVRKFETLTFDADTIKAKASEFDEKLFEKQMRVFVDSQWNTFKSKRS